MAFARIVAARTTSRRRRVIVATGSLEVEWVGESATPLHGLRRSAFVGGRVWEFDCAGADVLFDQVRPVCARLFSSLSVTISPSASAAPRAATGDASAR